MSADHAFGHTITRACPIRCLGLAQGTEDALVMHWRGDGRYAPTIRDLIQLRDDRDLTSIFGISYGREGEITRKLEARGLAHP